ncbi:MAG TPA: G5 domain-containing protein, partial [Acidimicrobiia bacterium]|nr:G5 domain-containing protein [Acidimicrobiia bacterium]
TLAGAGATVPRLLLKASPEVAIRVDGKKLVVSTGADTVQRVLRDEKVKLGSDDRVEPALAAEVHDGLDVAVYRAFDVVVDYDGIVAAVPTTRTNVGKLQRELALDPENVAVKSAPDRLGEGAAVVFRTRHPITVNVDGSTQEETSLALNVSEVLAENSVVLGPLDQVQPPDDTRVTDGMVVSVVRITNDATETVEEPLAFTVERRDDPSLPKGQERVAQEGVDGVQKVTYQITKADGAEVGRQAISKVPTKPATPKIVMVGTALPNERIGTASWYASPFGNDSCATKEYVPKGTILKVTNLDTGASTTCRVADRVVANRVVDLDDDVFRQLAPTSQGVFNARIDW